MGVNRYTERKWLRRAETVHRKLVELAAEIEEAEGETERWNIASNTSCAASELVTYLEPRGPAHG